LTRHVGKMILVEPLTPDRVAAMAFYSGEFGWTLKDLRIGNADYAQASFNGVGGDADGDSYDGGVRLGIDYYEPFGVDHGGCGLVYRVGPYRDGGPGGGGGHALPHAYRSAPAVHSLPSIAGRSRGGDWPFH
jgi:hypothetical protein